MSLTSPPRRPPGLVPSAANESRASEGPAVALDGTLGLGCRSTEHLGPGWHWGRRPGLRGHWTGRLSAWGDMAAGEPALAITQDIAAVAAKPAAKSVRRRRTLIIDDRLVTDDRYRDAPARTTITAASLPPPGPFSSLSFSGTRNSCAGNART